MRIGVVGPEDPDSFADNIVHSARRMGHDAHFLGPIYPGPNTSIGFVGMEMIRKFPKADSRLQRRLVKRVENLGPDLVVNVQQVMLPETVTHIKNLGAKTALWFPDCIKNLGRLMMFVSEYDGLFFKEPWIVRKATEVLGSPAFYLPEACNPEWHTPVTDDPVKPYVLVAGNLYPWRVRLLERLMERDIEVRIVGSGLPRWLDSPAVRRAYENRVVTRHEKAREFRIAGIVLNSLHPCEIEGLNCRLFEAAGCGAAVLTDWRSELPKYFETPGEVTSYTSFDTLVEAATWMLEHPAEARSRGDAAAKRANAEHTYEHRLEEMFDKLGLG